MTHSHPLQRALALIGSLGCIMGATMGGVSSAQGAPEDPVPWPSNGSEVIFFAHTMDSVLLPAPIEIIDQAHPVDVNGTMYVDFDNRGMSVVETDITFNAMGCRPTPAIGNDPAGNWLYAINNTLDVNGNTVTPHLVQIGVDTTSNPAGMEVKARDLGPIPAASGGWLTTSVNMGFASAVFDASGTRMYMRTERGGDYLYWLDFSEVPDPRAPISAANMPTAHRAVLANKNPIHMDDAIPDTGDLFYKDGYLWGFASHDMSTPASFSTIYLYRMDVGKVVSDQDPVPFNTFTFSNLSGDPFLSSIPVDATHPDNNFSAQWSYVNGAIGIIADHVGNSVQFSINALDPADPTNPAGLTITIMAPSSQVLLAGIKTPDSDGASCLDAPVVDLSVDKTVSPKYTPGTNGNLTYSITVTNNDKNTVSAGWTLTDVIPSELGPVGMTNVTLGNDWPTDSLTGNPTDPATVCTVDQSTRTLTCGGKMLPAGATRTITLTFPVPAQGVTIANTATVTGIDPEPVSDPHSNTATAVTEPLTTPQETIATDAPLGGTTMSFPSGGVLTLLLVFAGTLIIAHQTRRTTS